MIGREAETDFIERDILSASGKMMFPPAGFHVSGEPDMGKTTLIKHVRGRLAQIENAVALGPDSEMMPYLSLPLDELIGMRNDMREAYPDFDSEAFDLAAMLFMKKFKRRGAPDPQLPGAERALAEVFRASFVDTVKKGAEDSLTGLRAWATSLMGSGGGAGGALKAGAIANGATAALSWATVASVAASAVTVGAATLTTAVTGKLVYHLVKGFRLRARQGRIRERFPLLDGIVGTPDRNYNEFFKYLAYMLGDAISQSHDGARGYIPVLFLDPGDDLASKPEGPIAQVGKMYALVFDHVVHKFVITSSREKLTAWLAGAMAGRCAPKVDYKPIELGKIPLSEAQRWSQANAYTGKWPAPALGDCSDGKVFPKALADFQAGLDSATPEDEIA